MDDEGQSMISSENPDDNEGGMSDNDPDKDKDPGYHGEPESQEYLANVYYDIITNWDSS